MGRWINAILGPIAPLVLSQIPAPWQSTAGLSAGGNLFGGLTGGLGGSTSPFSSGFGNSLLGGSMTGGGLGAGAGLGASSYPQLIQLAAAFKQLPSDKRQELLPKLREMFGLTSGSSTRRKTAKNGAAGAKPAEKTAAGDKANANDKTKAAGKKATAKTKAMDKPAAK